MEYGIKKWFMLQFWRVQQVAQILTLFLLGVTDSFLLWDKIQWRGGIIADPYLGPTILLLSIALVIWVFSIFWDLRLKMWRHQMSVLVEKNPYMKERFSPKEIATYGLVWLPMLDHMAKSDPSIKEHAVAMRRWLKRELTEDALTTKEIDEIFEYIGEERKDPLGLEKQ
jgi:hypothetical protein